jgi:RNA polymerase sigma-70 factor, ECF subfamily
VTAVGIPTHRQDQDLARAAAGGSEEAWREIYDATCQPLFNFLCYQIGDREAARDVLQETYLRAFQRLDSYRGSGTLLSWLRGIAVRRATDRWRHLRGYLRHVVSLTEPVAQDSADPEAGRRQLAEEARLDVDSPAFQAALQRLSPQQRACLLLHEFEDLSHAQIARELGCNESTVRVHHHRAVLKMRAWLATRPAVPADEMGGVQA